MKPKIGEVVYIQSYKHDGSLHRTWSTGTILDVDAEKIVLITYKTWVVDSDGRKWFTREPAICFFYFERWYNVIAMIRQRGVYYYCNLASPIIYDGESLKNIDYDLDVKRFPDGKIIVLDEGEFECHRKKMNYPKELVDLIVEEKNKLVERVKDENSPFQEKVIFDYFNKFFDIKEI